MNPLRDIVIGVLLVVCIMAVVPLIGADDTSLVLAGVASAAVLFQAAMHHGPPVAVATGLAAAVGLLLLRQTTGVPPDPALLLAAAGFPAMGLVFGLHLSARRVSAEEIEQAGVELRRELYRLKKESQATRMPAIRAVERSMETSAPVSMETDVLLAVVARIASSLTEHRVIESTLTSVRDLLGVEHACFHLHERGTDRFLAGQGLQAEREQQPVGDNGTLLQLVRSRRETVSRAADDEQASRAFSVARPEIHLAVPVFDRAMLTGVLLVSKPDHPGPDSERLVGILAAASGLALSAARLVERCEEQSKRDPLTGLIDVETVRSLLDESLSRGPVAILLVAADGIQKVNETYGRRAGDKVVAALSRQVSMEIGSAGQVGRYGGATLLVVLPGHRLEAARELAGRLERRVPQSIHAGPEGLAGPLTVSLGVAAASAGSVDMLTQTAEQSLSEAQQTNSEAQLRGVGEGRDLDAQP